MTVEQFGKALVASGLMTADDVKALWTTIPADARPKSAADFGKLLVDKSLLTPFQVAEIIAGRGARLVMGDYTIAAQIGAGGMGQVYKANHRRMKRTVALKVMSSAAMQDEAAVKRFQREVHAAAKLEHPNIVTAYDSGESGNVKYLVMQFVDGGDLSDLVKKGGRLPIEQAVGYVIQAARGLAFAHGEGVIHRDIKPANLLLDKKGVVKILDMGLARFEDGGDGLTATEQVMGTVDYMSPEQAANTKGCDGRADIYSLGCTLWFLLTGKKLYEGDTLIARLMLHRDGPLPSLVKERDDAPWPLEQALHKMIAKRVQDRYQTMDEAISALAPFGGAAAGGSSAGSSLSVNTNADLASFMQAMGTGGGTKTNLSATQAKPATNLNVDATAQFTSPDVGTDPKSQILPNAATTPKPQPTRTRTKSGGNKSKLIAAGGLGALLLLAGIIVKIRDKDGNVVAEVNAPTGTSAEVITTPQTSAKPIAPATTIAPASNVAALLDSPDYEWTKPENLGPTINGPADQILYSLTNDQLRLYFGRKGGPEGVDNDVVEVARPSPTAPFGAPKLIGHGAESFVSGDGLTFVYAGPDVTMRLRSNTDDPFGPPDRLSQVNTPTSLERRPTLSPDGLTLVFHTDRNPDQKADLWISRRRSQKDSFGPAQNIGPPVNTSGYEQTGTLLADNRTLIFVRSTGNEGWLMTTTNSLGKPAVLSLRSNPFGNTWNLWLAPDARTAYFSADLPGGFGGKDIYVSRLVPKNGAPSPPSFVASVSPSPVTPSAAGNVVYLDDLPETEYKDGHMKLGKHNLDYNNSPYTWRGKEPTHALMTHPSKDKAAIVSYRLNGRYETFSVTTGLSDATKENLRSPLIFRVLGDGREIWRSGPVQKLTDEAPASFSVRGVQELRLEVSCGNSNFHAHAVWFEPLLTLASSTNTTTGVPTSPPPAGDYALKFVMSERVEAPNPQIDESQPFTVEAYFTPGDADRNSMIAERLFGIDSGFHFEIKDSRWRFYSTHNEATSPERFVPRRRVHVAGVRTTTGRQLYLDGKLVASKDDPLKLASKQSETPLVLEARGAVGVVVDELRISQGVVYDKEFAPPAKLTADKNTLALYHFDEGFGDVLKDSSGKGRDGKITGATWVKADGSPIPATAPAPTTIPAEVLTFAGHRYLLVDSFGTWSEAKAKAESMGGHLATINGKEERTWLLTNIFQKRPRFGDSDRARQVFLGGVIDLTAGPTWKWVTGEPFDESLWLGSKPTDADKSGLSWITDTQWNGLGTDGPGYRSHFFLVEWDTLGPVEASPSPPAAVRWPLAASKPEDIEWLRSLNARLVLRQDAAGDRDVRVHDPIPPGPNSIVGIEFSRDSGPAITDQVLARVAGLGDLESLTLNFATPGSAATAEGLKPLAALTNLRKLALGRIGWPKTDPAFLGSFRNLESLELSNITILGWEPHVARLPNLSALTLYGVDDAKLEQLGAMPKLMSLRFAGYQNHHPRRFAAAQPFIAANPWCRVTYVGLDGDNMKQLVVEPTAPPPAGPASQPIAKMPAALRWPLAPSKPEDIRWALGLQGKVTLRSDPFGGAPVERVISKPEEIPPGSATIVGVEIYPTDRRTTDADLERIATLVDLETFVFGNQKQAIAATSAGLLKLAALVNLRRLDVHHFKNYAAGASGILKAMPRLNYLYPPHSTAAAEEWIGVAATLPSIQELHLFRCDVTDAGLAPVEKMPQLALLDIRDNSMVTLSAIERIAAAVPGCRIRWGTNEDRRTIEPRTASAANAGVENPASVAKWLLDDKKLGRIRVVVDGREQLVTTIPTAPFKVVELDFSPSNNAGKPLSEAEIARLAVFTDLESLELGGQPLTDAGLAGLAGLKKLKKLIVNDTPLTPAAVTTIRQFPQLESLHTFSTDEWLKPLAGMPTITAMTIYRSAISAQAMSWFPQYPNLSELELHSCFEAPGLRLSEALAPLKECKNLKKLHLNTSKFDTDALAVVSGLSGLIELDLSVSQLTEEQVKQLAAALPRCQVKWKDGANNFKQYIFEPTAPPGEPTTSSTPRASSGGETPTSVVQWLIADKKLNTIVFEIAGKRVGSNQLPAQPFKVVGLNFHPANNAGKPLSATEVARLAALTDLEELILSGQPLTDAALATLAPLKKLKVLDLTDTKLTPAAVATLRQFPQLEKLQSFSTDEWLRALAGMPTIRSLIFHRSAISTEGMKTLSQYPNLSELSFSDCRELDDPSSILPAAPLKDCRTLTRLTLIRGSFVPSMLDTLAGLTQLRELVVDGPLTADQIRTLAAALPGCRITYNDAANKKTVVEPTAPPAPQSSAPAATSGKLFMHDPAFAEWLQETKSKAAPEQLAAVSKKLMELNPGFDGKLLDSTRKQPPIVEAGVVTKLSVQGSTLTDLSPLKALSGLKELGLGGAGSAGQVADLSPLEGLPLVWLDLSGPGNKVTDLSPLRAMQLEHLACRDLRELVDITPLAGMPLKHLDLLGTKVVNLSAVKGMPLEVLVLSKEVSDISALQGLRLTHLECHSISDLAPLKGMPLKTLWCDVAKISDYTPLYEFTALKELRIFSAKDPAAVKAALQKALPNCKLEVK